MFLIDKLTFLFSSHLHISHEKTLGLDHGYCHAHICLFPLVGGRGLTVSTDAEQRGRRSFSRHILKQTLDFFLFIAVSLCGHV